jgi:hypothetical protein
MARNYSVAVVYEYGICKPKTLDGIGNLVDLPLGVRAGIGRAGF